MRSFTAMVQDKVAGKDQGVSRAWTLLIWSHVVSSLVYIFSLAWLATLWNCPLELREGHGFWNLFPTSKNQGTQKGFHAQELHGVLLSYMRSWFLKRGSQRDRKVWESRCCWEFRKMVPKCYWESPKKWSPKELGWFHWISWNIHCLYGLSPPFKMYMGSILSQRNGLSRSLLNFRFLTLNPWEFRFSWVHLGNLYFYQGLWVIPTLL